MLSEFYGVSRHEISAFRELGLNEKELALLFILTRSTGIKTENPADQYVNKGLSWSEIAHQHGIEPAAAGKLILQHQPG